MKIPWLEILMIFAAGFTEFFHKSNKQINLLQGPNGVSGDNVLWIKVFLKAIGPWDVTFRIFRSCGFSYLWGEAGEICNITSLILCRDTMGTEELIPRFRRSIHLYQWDPENPCCMAQTSWLLVNQMSILPGIQRTGVWAVLETWVFWKGKKQQNVQERSFLVPGHPNTVWEGLF